VGGQLFAIDSLGDDHKLWLFRAGSLQAEGEVVQRRLEVFLSCAKIKSKSGVNVAIEPVESTMVVVAEAVDGGQRYHATIGRSILIVGEASRVLSELLQESNSGLEVACLEKTFGGGVQRGRVTH